MKNLRIEASSGWAMCSVSWEDDFYRYHVWEARGGGLEDEIHRNPLDHAVNGHRSLDGLAKSRAKEMAAVRAIGTQEAFDAARAEAKERMDREYEAELKAARLHALRDAVQTIIGASADDLAEALAPADVLIAAAATKLREVGQ